MKKGLFLCFAFVLFTFSFLLCSKADARTEGFYIGGGYQQPFMYTWKKQGTYVGAGGTPGNSITFWPGVGAYLVGGYEFGRPDWLGLALPVNWSYMKLNKSEWVNMFNADAEALFHLTEPDTKFDIYLGALVGFNYLMEGKVQNESSSMGPSFGMSFGFKYSIMEYAVAGSPRIKNLSLVAELPVKIILIMNDYDLSNSKTTPIMNFPLHVGLTYTF